MTAWLVPTVRATSWWALIAVSALLACVSLISVYADQWPAGQVGVVAAAMAAAVVAGLHDPAESLLAASPTSPDVRRVRRLTLLMPASLAIWLSYVGIGRLIDSSVEWSPGTLLALAVTGIAAEAWFGLEAGVAVPLAWYLAAWAGHAVSSDAAEVLFAWQHHPWTVTVAAVAALTARSFR